MLRSLYSGISGMKVNQVKLDVIANNIANVGTTAFKSSRVRFQDMISQSITQNTAPATNQGGVNARQAGQGVQVAGIDTITTQGMMQPTSRSLDVAMDGEGYLMVAKGATPKGTATETTAGTNEGVTLGNDYAVGDANGMELFYTRDGALTVDKNGNLLNSDGLRILGYAVNDGTNTSLQYDANGDPVIKYANANSTTITTGQQLIPLVIPETVYVPAIGIPTDANYVAATTLKVTTFTIEKDGQIKAVLEDGKVAVLGQIAVSSFKNPEGLSKVGGNLYQNTSNSGEAVVRTGSGAATDNSGGYGDMLQGMLEMSNVDLAEQFTDMIVAQRAFQASGKSITTGDEILQEIIGLKR